MSSAHFSAPFAMMPRLRAMSVAAGVTSSMPIEKPASPSARAESFARRDMTCTVGRWGVDVAVLLRCCKVVVRWKECGALAARGWSGAAHSVAVAAAAPSPLPRPFLPPLPCISPPPPAATPCRDAHRRRDLGRAVGRERVEEAALVAAEHRLAEAPADELAVADRDVAVVIVDGVVMVLLVFVVLFVVGCFCSWLVGVVSCCGGEGFGQEPSSKVAVVLEKGALRAAAGSRQQAHHTALSMQRYWQRQPCSD